MQVLKFRNVLSTKFHGNKHNTLHHCIIQVQSFVLKIFTYFSEIYYVFYEIKNMGNN